ncbi:CsbD family protein [Oenococcus oeni]|uniref:CsbD-like domain-containing protein n=1 Tax=Oenococcus oeni ATCC BAA-1163 TaxID=379360 RepID=A0NHR8_OENOE|nr:CsbD family protein [Oenococcus oeni]EAV39956.1 hypothetical protein OENOO_36007 [Oenococcus oeni ATCC BAA-1163]EJN98606.1 hypothetical protein AWRIB418_1743 [Oenococcus oeni AWRIB418]KDE86857.1 hypothetical protein EL27_02490 [Oenococcus oeni]KGH57920.1 hypothetical protein X288_08680 [Oenococcus oeni IOEB_9805]KGH58847.1 hypothetical protein X289_00895 [Oenococcus oeni IOEB_B10]
MSLKEKADSLKKEAAGMAKEVEGKATGDKVREGEGKAGKLLGKAKEKLSDKEKNKMKVDQVERQQKKHD